MCEVEIERRKRKDIFFMPLDSKSITPIDSESVRSFSSGATRHIDDNKHDYEGYLSPYAIRRYGEYMLGHQIQADGTKRASDNWQKGIPVDVYMKSLFRHVVDSWSIRRGLHTIDTKDGHKVDIEEALCGVLFNAFGLLHEILKEKHYGPSNQENPS